MRYCSLVAFLRASSRNYLLILFICLFMYLFIYLIKYLFIYLPVQVNVFATPQILETFQTPSCESRSIVIHLLHIHTLQRVARCLGTHAVQCPPTPLSWHSFIYLSHDGQWMCPLLEVANLVRDVLGFVG